jgi:hypothetical protein
MIHQKELEGLELLMKALSESRAALLERQRTEEVEHGQLVLSNLLHGQQACRCEQNRAFWDELGAAVGVAHNAIKERDRLACESGDWRMSLKLLWERIGIDVYCTRIIFGRLFSGGANIAALRQRR